MGFRDGMKVVGHFDIKVFDKDGNLKDSRSYKNLVVNSGKAAVADLIGGVNGIPVFEYIAIGSGTTAPSVTDTGLEAEIARKQASKSLINTSVANDTLQLVATFSAADGLTGKTAITETGVFNAASGGTMLSRQTFDVVTVNWDSGDTIQITWRIQIT